MADIPLSVAVPQIYVPSLSNPQIKVPHIEVPHIEVPGAGTVKPIAPYREHVKDLGDLLLGHPIIGTEELHDTLVDNGLGMVEWVPILNRVVGAGLMMKERFIEPTLRGDVKEAGINTLETLGGTLDTLANPVKSLLPWTGGGTPTDLMKSMGWVEGEYRKDYQWETGNFLVDLAGEVLSDPSNWVTFGGKTLLKESTDIVIDSYRRVLTKELGEHVARKIPDDVIKRIVIDTSDDLVDDAGEIVHKLMKRVEENRFKYQDELLKVPKKSPNYARKQALLKEYDDALTIGKHFDLLDRVADLRLTDGLRKYNSIRKVIKTADKVDNFLLAAGLGLNPLASGTALLMTKVVGPKFKVLFKSAVTRLNKVDVSKLMNNNGRGLKAIGEYIALKNKALNKVTFTKFDDLLNKYSLDVKKLQNIYLTIANSIPPSKLSINYVNELFLDKLKSSIPEIRILYNKEAMGLISDITIADVEELISAISDGGVIMYSAEQLVFRDFKKFLEKDMADFWKGPVKDLKDYSALDRLNYIDKRLSMFGKDFSIYNLKEALEFINTDNPDLYVRMSGLLDYVGINLNNNFDVATLLKYANNGDDRAVKKLEQILTKSRTGALLQLEETVEAQRALSKFFHSVKPKLNFGNDLSEDAVVNFFNNAINNKSAELYSKTYTDMNDKILKEIANIAKIKQNIIDAITDKGVDLEKLLATLDELENYAGAEYTTSGIFHNVLDFNTDNLDLESIKTFADNLERLQKTITMWHQRIANNQVEMQKVIETASRKLSTNQSYLNAFPDVGLRITQGLPKSFADTIADLNSLLKKEPIQKTINNFRDLYNMGESFYRLVVSQQGMYALMELNIMADMPEEWLKELSNIDSPTRINLQYISNMLRRQRASLSQDLSKAIDDILTTIDCTNCLYTLMSKADYITSFDIPKEQVDFIKGMLFNVIYENKNKWVSRMLEEPEKLTQQFIREFKKHNYKAMMNHFDNIIKETKVSVEDSILADKMRELRSIIDSGEATDEIFDAYDELKYLGIDETLEQPAYLNAYEMYTAFIDELTKNVNAAFDEYTKALSELQKLTGNEIKFGKFFTNETVAHMNELGLNYNEIIEAMTKENATYDDFIMVTDFITRVSGNIIQPELDKAKAIIMDTMNINENGKNVDEILTNSLKELSENTLARSITKTFQEIDALNSYLSGNDTVIAKLKNKYGTLTKIKNHLGYVTVDKFNEFVRYISSYENSYGWSTSHGFLAVKKDFDPLFIAEHNLTADLLRGVDAIDIEDIVTKNNTLNQEYVLFYNMYKDAYRYVDGYAAINNEYVKEARKSLIEVFSDNAISWGPINPSTYFLAATDKEILAWDIIASNQYMSKRISKNYAEIKKKLKLLDNKTAPKKYTNFKKKSKLVSNKTTKLSIEEQIKQYKNPAGVYLDIRSKLDGNVLLDDDEWEEIIDEIADNQDTVVFDGLREDLSSYIKDPDSLQIYKRDFENYIRNDIEALNNTKVFAELSKDTRLVKEVISDPTDSEVLNLLKLYYITPDTPMNDPKVLKFLTAERSAALADTIRSLNPNQLRYYLDHNTAGIMIFVNDKSNFKFNFTAKQLDEAGIRIDVLKDNENIFIISTTGKEAPTKKSYFKYRRPKYVFETVQQQITDAFKANRGYFYWNGMDLPDELFTGEMMNKEIYEAILDDKRIVDILKQNSYSNSFKTRSNNFYTKKISRPNLAIIGTPNAYNTVLDAFSDTLKAKNITPYYASTRIDKVAWRGSISAIKRVNTEHKYLQLFLNDDFSLGGPMFKRVLSDATDEQLKNLFKRNNFDACIIRANKKGEPTVYKIYIENQKQLADAVEAGAIIVPHEVYRNMVLSLNQHRIDAKLLGVYRRTIVATFKTIYLTSPGFLMRNALDSLFYKNLSSTDGLASFSENFKYEYRAARMLQQYDDIVKRTLKLAEQEQGTPTFNRFYLKKVLNTLSEDERVAFRLTDVFMNSSASSGLTESLQEFLLDYNMKDAVLNEYAWETWYKKNILNNAYVTGIQNINDYIEKTARYGLFLNLVDNGTELTDAVRRVINTHFDYQIKEPGVDLIEQIFWFSTFPINNMLYYMNEGLTRNPDMLKLQMDALELSWNDGVYTWEELKNSDYLSYNALTGNIRFEWNGKQIVIKTGSSVMDFFKLMFDPVGEAADRLNPFLAVLTGLEDISQLNPTNTVTSRIKQIKSGQSYIPSVYAKLYNNQPKRRHYIEREPYVKRTWSYAKPKRTYFKKPDNMKRMKYLFTTNRYYFGRGKNAHRWLDSTTSIEPHWYIDNYRHYKFGKNYKSLSKSMQLRR